MNAKVGQLRCSTVSEWLKYSTLLTLPTFCVATFLHASIRLPSDGPRARAQVEAEASNFCFTFGQLLRCSSKHHHQSTVAHLRTVHSLNSSLSPPMTTPAAFPLNHAHLVLKRLLRLNPGTGPARHHLILVGSKVESRDDTDRELPFRQEVRAAGLN